MRVFVRRVRVMRIFVGVVRVVWVPLRAVNVVRGFLGVMRILVRAVIFMRERFRGLFISKLLASGIRLHFMMSGRDPPLATRRIRLLVFQLIIVILLVMVSTQLCSRELRVESVTSGLFTRFEPPMSLAGMASVDLVPFARMA